MVSIIDGVFCSTKLGQISCFLLINFPGSFLYISLLLVDFSHKIRCFELMICDTLITMKERASHFKECCRLGISFIAFPQP